ncbi:MAG: amino acid permease [Acidobacteria bacterium]|nr:MAG: amino acid permease [Acidobacteriota bacterium]HLB90451.1 amino acid permease [Terriglobales bacterium]
MSEPSLGSSAAVDNSRPTTMAAREAGLQRNLTPAQLAMLGLGSTIGTGLFLGSAIAVKLAGPAVILSFIAGGCIALPMMWALAEMAAAHPAAGSFGLYAEMYLHPWAGFAIRLTYWLCMMVVVGSEVVAASIYCRFWFPGTPSWVWIGSFSVIILYVNTTNIGSLGTFEYWLSMVKVVTILAFLILGSALLFGVGFPRVGLANYTAHGGFYPHGWRGVGLGVTLGLFSFFGIEVVGSTAGEAADPKVAVPKALRRTLSALALFYVAGLALVVGIVPWTQIGMGESPFVRVFQTVGIPAASHIMNFVVLTAALSSAIANLYFAARLAFSLARGGYLPTTLGRLSGKDMPVIAVLVSGCGMAAALVLSRYFQDSLFVFMIGLSTFGALFAWLMTLLTHLAFRRFHKRQAKPYLQLGPRGPWASLAGLTAILAVMVSTWWVPGFQITLLAGVPWLASLTVCYFVWRGSRSRRSANGDSLNG